MANSVWSVAKKYPKSLDEELSFYPRIIRQIAYLRGLTTKDTLDRFMKVSYKKDMHDPFLFRDMGRTLERIMDTKQSGETVTIYGDYDADGIDGSAILAKTFEALGIKFNSYIPHRQIEGYGLNRDAISLLAKEGTKLIVTVDCGISNVTEIDFANKKGIDVIITDHHNVLKSVPRAYAILHPKLDGETYPDRNLTGGGVAFKLAQALIRRNHDTFHEGFEKWLLDLAAIATIADYGKLVGENRTIVKYGLIVLNKTRNPGLQALKSLAGLKRKYDCMDVAMKIIPLINAAGRMNHGVAAYEALIESDDKKAEEYAAHLDNENKKRREMSEMMYTEAIADAKGQERDKLIVVKNKKWPITLVGIIATRLVNELGKPILAIGNKNTLWAGSGRSIPEYDLTEMLQEKRSLFKEYGGHAAAGGFTIKKSITIDNAVKELKQHADKILKGVTLTPKIEIDAEIDLDEIQEELIDWLVKLKPYGAGNPQPRFLIKKMKLDEVYPLGKNGTHLKLMIPKKGGGHIKCIFFNGTKKYADVLTSGTTCDAVIELDYNEWLGISEIQVKIVDIKV